MISEKKGMHQQKDGYKCHVWGDQGNWNVTGFCSTGQMDTNGQKQPTCVVGMLEMFPVDFEMYGISNIYTVSTVSEDAGLTENGVAKSKRL